MAALLGDPSGGFGWVLVAGGVLAPVGFFTARAYLGRTSWWGRPQARPVVVVRTATRVVELVVGDPEGFARQLDHRLRAVTDHARPRPRPDGTPTTAVLGSVA